MKHGLLLLICMTSWAGGELGNGWVEHFNGLGEYRVLFPESWEQMDFNQTTRLTGTQSFVEISMDPQAQNFESLRERLQNRGLDVREVQWKGFRTLETSSAGTVTRYVFGGRSGVSRISFQSLGDEKPLVDTVLESIQLERFTKNSEL